MNLNITADWVFENMTELHPGDGNLGDLLLLVHDKSDWKLVNLVFDQLGIFYETRTYKSSNNLTVEGWNCYVMDFIKVQDKIPEFIQKLKETGYFNHQFESFEKAQKLKRILSNIVQ